MSEFKPIQSIQRAIDILNCFNPNRFAMSIRDISEETGLHINTTRGIVQTLKDNGLLFFDEETGRYSLGFYFNNKASIITGHIATLINLVKPHMAKLAEKHSMTASLEIVRADTVTPIYSIASGRNSYSILVVEFTHLPLHCSGAGKAYLAFGVLDTRPDFIQKIPMPAYTEKTITDHEKLLRELNRIKKRGYSIENNEFEPMVNCVSVPLYDSYGDVFATISLTGTIGREKTDFETIGKDMIKTVKSINLYT